MRTLSIVIPVYKVEPFVGRCLQSIIAQESDDLSIQCILVDDCSPDNSVAAARSVIDGYHGSIDFQIILQETNMGPSAARNVGIRAATGEYILFVDSDDRLPEGALAKMFEAWDTCPEADMVVGNYFSVRDNAPFPLGLNTVIVAFDYTIRQFVLNYRINSTPWNKLMRRQFLLDNDLLFVEGMIFEDTNWTYGLLKKTHRVVVVPDVTYIYENENPQSIMNTTREKATLSINSIAIIGDTVIGGTYADLFADSMLYLLTFVIKAMELRRQAGAEPQASRRLDDLRRRIVVHCLKHGRLFLALYFVCLLYPPFSYALRIGWVRRHYDKMEKGVRAIVGLLEKLH